MPTEGQIKNGMMYNPEGKWVRVGSSSKTKISKILAAIAKAKAEKAEKKTSIIKETLKPSNLLAATKKTGQSALELAKKPGQAIKGAVGRAVEYEKKGLEARKKGLGDIYGKAMMNDQAREWLKKNRRNIYDELVKLGY